MLKPKYFKPELIGFASTPNRFAIYSISSCCPFTYNNNYFPLFISSLEALPNLQNMLCKVVHFILEKMPKTSMSSTKNLCEILMSWPTMSAWKSSSKHAFFILWLRPSMIIINSNGDNEHPCRSPLRSPKKPVGYPLVMTAYMIVVTHAIIHSMLCISRPNLCRTMRRYF